MEHLAVLILVIDAELLFGFVHFSLTLNKLKQARLLEEKIVLKRALQLEKLQEKQTAEFVVSTKLYIELSLGET